MSNKANLIWDILACIGFIILIVIHSLHGLETWVMIAYGALLIIWSIRLIYRYRKYKNS